MSNVHTPLFDECIREMADIYLKDKTVFADNSPLKSLKVADISDNIVFMRQPTASFFAEGYTLVYFLDSSANAQKLIKGEIPLLIFPKGSFFSGGSPITDVWKKKYQQSGHEHILGLLEGSTMPDSIYVDYMSVRPHYRRNRINSLMIEVLKTSYPDAKVSFSSATPDGQKFIKSYTKEHGKI